MLIKLQNNRYKILQYIYIYVFTRKAINYWWIKISIIRYSWNIKKIKLLGNTPSQPSKFRTKNWIELHDNSRGTYTTNGQIKFENSMLKSSSRDYSNVYTLVKGIITVPNTVVAAANNADKRVILVYFFITIYWLYVER